MSTFKKLSDLINIQYTKILSFGIRKLCRHSYSKLYNLHKSERGNIVSKKELDIFKNKWKSLDRNPDPKAFKLYAQYIGPDPNILPEDICANIIQPILNPIETRPYYQDKNVFEKILPKHYLPSTIIREINNILLSSDYQPITPPFLKN